jgi:hypothetical protein
MERKTIMKNGGLKCVIGADQHAESNATDIEPTTHYAPAHQSRRISLTLASGSHGAGLIGDRGLGYSNFDYPFEFNSFPL